MAQSSPVPSVPVVDQFKDGTFPVGQILLYQQNNNLLRVTAEETRAKDRQLADTLSAARHGAEVHRQVRQYMQAYIKPGLLMTEICETLEGLSRRLVKENGLHAGIAFPTGCSLNHVAAHYTPNTGDSTRLAATDVMKIDFGVHIAGRIIDCAWTWAPDPRYAPLLECVQDSTNTGIKTAGIDVRLCDIGEAVEEVMSSYEIELDGKTIKIKSVRNLCGHSIDPYKIHGGKCLGRDTPVLMFDGSVKAVQDVRVGDRVMGDDGTARRVLATTAGRARMFRVGSAHSAPFTCNGAHILSLKLVDVPPHCGVAAQRHADGTVRDFAFVDAARADAPAVPDVLDIAVDDLVKMDAAKLRHLRTYRVAKPLHFAAARELADVLAAFGESDGAGGATVRERAGVSLERVEFVARSLGRAVTRVAADAKKRKGGSDAAAAALYIAAEGARNDEPLDLVALRTDEYFGFALDGNHRFVLGHSFVVTHNSVPNVKGGDASRMEEGEFYAIETFGSTGKGHVIEDGECSHYMKSFDAARTPLRMTGSKQLLQHINKTFDTLAFCRRWLDSAGQKQYLMALKNLCDLEIVKKYPPLCDRKGSYVAQFEHTIFLRPTCKEVVSRGDDY
jgi:methionine aminopeptidase